MSSPHVAGAAALLMSYDSTLSPGDVQNLLEQNAVDLGSSGFDTDFGWGRIDVWASLLAADTTAPVVTPSAGITQEATSSSGSTVNYPAAMATDDVGVTIGPTCSPASGSTFSIGDTTVTCTAQDAAGNVGSATFTITVLENTYCNDMTITQLISSGFYNLIDNRGGPSATLTGTDNDDLILAGDNGDTIFAKAGNDCIIGGSGNADIKGEAGNDEIFWSSWHR